ncbi:Single-stranded-DNA-specific exonuclease RecJ [Planctomycetes bacterium Pan216]|uniref:Single-stranded-DNA-specific exonuclease RecJ n=1 Tax=Kolteria novifilia TaxID=2527975 RepID=A0A518AZD6_9BACT|nr:Single-stranded-DNA-specific exonuclease RecJ [Planctomycetes bacterium Pan216]
MSRRWILSPDRREAGFSLAESLRVHPVVGHLLANRGVEKPEDARRFLQRQLSSLHDPESLPGAVDAAERLHEAVAANKNILIYGDYDVDGMCGTAVLLRCLKLAGVQPRFYVPDRLEEGYGVNLDSLQRLREEGIDLVITVDCGITSVEEARRARELGLEFIVTDHHEFQESLPEADAVVHPRLPGSEYPFGELCGAGVAFKLAWQFARRYTGQQRVGEIFQRFLLEALGLVALATIADVVPLRDENRVIVHHGLQSIQRSPTLGIQRLMRICGLTEKSQLGVGDVAFTLAPRLNACGRLGQARLGIELLTTGDPSRANELAAYLETANKDRQTLERRVFTEAKKLHEEMVGEEGDLAAIVLASEEWHPGVVGIVASRMVERFHRPCILIALSEELGSGSARSIPGFDIQEALTHCQEHLLTCGGHAMAAGMRITPEKIDAFRERFTEVADRRILPEQRVPVLRIDVEVPLHTLTNDLIRSLAVMEPFGLSNPSPVMLATDLQLVGEPKCVGGGGRHLSFRVRQNGKAMKAIAFGMADRAEELASDNGKCCVVFSPIVNEFRGFKEVELQVKDFRAGSRVTD